VRFALLRDAEVARERGIPAFAGMTKKKPGMTEKRGGDSFCTAWKAGIQRKSSAVRAHCELGGAHLS